MVDLTTLQAISYIMGSLGVFVAAVYYIFNMRATLQTRQFQLLMQMSQDTRSREGERDHIEWLNMDWIDYDDFEKKYGSDNNPDNFALRSTMTNWYNTMGILLQYRMIDPELVYDFSGQAIIWTWNKFKDITLKQRELYNAPESSKPWEYLYGEMKRIHERRGHSTESSNTPAKYSPEIRERALALERKT